MNRRAAAALCAAALLSGCGKEPLVVPESAAHLPAADTKDANWASAAAIERGAALFEQRSAEDPRDGISRAQAARLLLRLARVRPDPSLATKADSLAREALEIDPGHGPSAACLAQSLIVRGQAERALVVCDEFLRRGVPFPEVLERRVDACLALGRTDGAEKSLDRLLERGESFGSLLAAARVALACGRAEESSETATRAVAAGDDECAHPFEIADAWAVMAAARAARGDHDGARSAVRRAQELLPGEPVSAAIGAAAASKGER